jgi:hypothetical protein
MLLTPQTFPLILLCAAAALVPFVICWCAASRRFALFSESILAALVCGFFAITLEVRGLSLLPVSRPLDWLPAVHIVLCLAAAAVIHARFGRAFWLDPLRNAVKSAAGAWRECDWLVRAGVVVTLWLLAANLAYGIATGLFGWDEMAYHGPQAIQAFQDGRLAPLDSNLPWTYMYPKGAAVIWAWTMFFTRGDTLFHAVQLVFGFQLLLAAYVLARRMGAGRPGALCAVFAIAWMPLFLFLTTTASADIGLAAGAVGLLAFAAPAADSRLTPLSRLFAAACFTQAALIKMPVFPVLFGSAAIVYALLSQGARAISARLLRLARDRWVWAGMAVIAAGFAQYLQAWIAHGNPLYPIQVVFRGRVLFPGPVPSPQEFVTTHTSLGVLAKDDLARAYHAVWTDWYTTLNYDSSGTFGPVVIAAVLLLFAAFVISAVRARSLWGVLVSGAALIALIIPSSYHPRYGLPVTTVMAVCAAVFVSRLERDSRRALRSAFLIAAACGLHFTYATLTLSHKYMRTINRGSLLPHRATVFQETIQTGVPEFYPTPEMIRTLRTAPRGSLLVWNVSCFHALLWNREYSNRTLYLSATPGDRFPGGPENLTPLSPAQADSWRREILRLRPDLVLVYSNSDYARIVGSLPEYHVRMRDPESRGRGAMTLFERRDQGITPDSATASYRSAVSIPARP